MNEFCIFLGCMFSMLLAVPAAMVDDRLRARQNHAYYPHAERPQRDHADLGLGYGRPVHPYYPPTRTAPVRTAKHSTEAYRPNTTKGDRP
jgi:hypothetical protein